MICETRDEFREPIDGARLNQSSAAAGQIWGQDWRDTVHMHGNNTDKYRFDLLRSEQWMATGAEEWDGELRCSAGVSCSFVYPADSPKLGIVLTVYSGVCYSFD